MIILAIVLVILVIVAWLFSSLDLRVENEFVKGFAKTVSSISVGLAVVFVLALLLSSFLKPSPESIMPAFVSTVEIPCDLEQTVCVSTYKDSMTTVENAIDDTTCFYYSWAFFKTRNYDLSRNVLLKCCELNDKWEYTYDLGVVCGYLGDYEHSANYFELAASYDDIPLEDRGSALDCAALMQSYANSWMLSLLK